MTTLAAVLARSQALGFLGPGEPAFHVEHARGFGDELGDAATVVDLGSGGGVPGLVLAVEHPDRRFLLLDAMTKRCRFLEAAVDELGLGGRVVVRCGRAEVLGREAELRGTIDAVVSRSFGPPAVTAECAAPLLCVGGRLIVSEPPEEDRSTARWDADRLALLGLCDDGRRRHRGAAYRVLVQLGPCPSEYPRRVGVPAKRPLF